MAKLMGIDYGSVRVGVALSDDARSFAFAHSVHPNNDALLDTLAELADEEGVSAFVLGESDNPAGGENTITRRIGIFGEALQVRTGKPVHLESEAYTSALARRAIEPASPSRSTTKPVIDAAAAALILQQYLDLAKSDPTAA